MPLVGSPGTGYPDGQRLANYDSGPLWNFTMVASPNPQSSPVMNMQHFAAAGGYVLATVAQAVVTFTWYADALLVNEISAKTFTVDHNIPAALGGFMIPNLGPFLQVTVTNIGGNPYAINALVFGSNRISPIPWIPQNSIIIDQQAVAIGASTGVDVFPSDYYAGPCDVYYSLTQANTFFIQGLNASGNYDILNGQNEVANSNSTFTFVAPAGAWKFRVGNDAAVAAAYTLVVVASLTGAT